MDRDARVTAATERSQLQPGPAGRIKSCTWPGSDKFMKSSHPHENTVYFNLPSGNKSILNFCGRSLGLALLLRKDSGICLHGLFHREIQCFLSERSLWNSPLCLPYHRASWTSLQASQVYKLRDYAQVYKHSCWHQEACGRSGRPPRRLPVKAGLENVLTSARRVTAFLKTWLSLGGRNSEPFCSLNVEKTSMPERALC